MAYKKLPILPLKKNILLPYVTIPLAVGRPCSKLAVEQAVASEDKELVVVAQRDPDLETPAKAEDLYSVGTVGSLRQMQRTNTDELAVMVQGSERVTLIGVEKKNGLLEATVEPRPLTVDKTPELMALRQQVVRMADELASALRGHPSGLVDVLSQEEDTARVMYIVGSLVGSVRHLPQELLEKDNLEDGLRWIYKQLRDELEVAKIQKQIADRVGEKMSKEQREYLLRRQLDAIQEELGEKSSGSAEVTELRERLGKAKLPEEVRKESERELKRLERLQSMSPEYGVIRSYLELILDLPWEKLSGAPVNIPTARRVLDEDHWGLKDVKERILEHLGVLQLNPEAHAPILCLVGPPGVGKTSLGMSVARALERKFERLSLGGMHDEAELRGHRRTYIGAMPGRILQAIRRAGVRNPVLMLDEVDKLGRDFRGDPAAALLEILDPEQNVQFRDNYLELPFDLSAVLFITTANSQMTIPPPLLDRMETVRLPGYTEEDKQQIAVRYLWPRQRQRSGLTQEQCDIEEQTIKFVIQRYTREAGVRQLERALGRMARKVALRFAEGDRSPVTLKPEEVTRSLGPEPFFTSERRQNLTPGVAAGLAWTEQGGEVLYVETALVPGRNGLTLTGHLGEVMQESAKAAETCVWSRAAMLGIDTSITNNKGVHIHLPAGAIPKDGPSAGITVATALASLYSKKEARSDTAMTGEITITGLVLPVGGIKEKVLAARRAGISRVILPRANEKDLVDLDEPLRQEMQLILTDNIEQAWEEALASSPS